MVVTLGVPDRGSQRQRAVQFDLVRMVLLRGHLMHADDFTRICEFLFGPLWQSEAARHLGVTPRTISRWLSVGAVPVSVIEPLRLLVRSHLAKGEAVRKLLWTGRT